MRSLFRAALAAAALSAAGSLALAADPIRIGSVLSVTGPAAFLGEPELKTLQIYVEKANAEGGLLGRRSSSSPTTTVRTPRAPTASPSA